MSPIEYNIKALKQRSSECMQTAATQMISYFDDSVNVDTVVKDVPVYIENGEKIGTSPGHLASYFAQIGYKTTAYIFDVELFDRSWEGLSSQQIITELHKRQKYIPQNAWLSKYHHVLVDGWELFAQSGGIFKLPVLSVKFLHALLSDGPFLITLSSTYLNQQAKQRYDVGSDTFVEDPIKGRSLTHGVTCAGYKEGKFLIVDPDPPKGVDHHRWIDEHHLIASIMVAQTESDNLIIAIEE